MNETIPINRLPPGIIAKVLKFCESDKDLISATHVCRRWRSALTSAPSLWTKIAFQDPNRALAYLTRSGALPIDVSVRTWNSHPEDFDTSDIPWLDRVQSMDLRGNEKDIEAILRQLSHPAPLLRILKVDGRYHWTPVQWRAPGSVDFPREFLGGQAPSLRDLSLDSISLAAITKFPLANLTSLTCINRHSGNKVEDLLPVLASAPLLENLTLHLRVMPVSPAGRKVIVGLDELRVLSWTNDSGAFSLTSCLSTPKLHWLILHVNPGMETRQQDLASILPPYEGYFPLLLEPTTMRYTGSSGTHFCQFISSTAWVDIKALRSSNDDDVRAPWFLRNAAISFKRIEEMCIRLQSSPLGEFPTERFESLQTLELVDDGVKNFTLMKPYDDGPISVVPFPALQEVKFVFDSYISLDGLAEILWRRKGKGHKVKIVTIWRRWDRDIRKVVADIGKSVDEVVPRTTYKIDSPRQGRHGCTIQ